MANFVFTSPGVKFREKDLTMVRRESGVTTLGVVGETEKGAAFSPVRVEDKGQFRQKFGRQNPKRFPNGELQYQLPYVANTYLEESNQLYVTRVLGLSGYDAGKAWAITLDAGVDLTTSGVTDSETFDDEPFSGNTFMGNTLEEDGDEGSFFTGFTGKTNQTFDGKLYEFVAYDMDEEDGTGKVSGTTKTISGSSYQEYENMVLAVIRSRARVEDKFEEAPETIFTTKKIEVESNPTNVGAGDMFAEFELKTESNIEGLDDETYIVSMDPSSSNYLPRVLGKKPKDKDTMVWVESVYPDLIKKLDADGIGYAINTELIEADTDIYTNYKTQFKTPETPWVVSQIRGKDIDRLFKFISVSDGNAANKEIKISIVNIDPVTREFDVHIRDFYDNDNDPEVLESFTRCSLMEGQSTFIGTRIGTYDGKYEHRSEYVSLQLADDIPEDVFPAGFEGYWFNNFHSDITGDEDKSGTPPKIMYKTEYTPTDRINRVYLGITPAAYSGEGLVGTGINQNFFNFNGWYDGVDMGTGNELNFVKTNGFHMDSDVEGKTFKVNETYIGKFDGGVASFKKPEDVLVGDSPYTEENARKFTFVPTGGFDGWDEHRDGRTHGDAYREGGFYSGVGVGQTPSNDYQAWQTGIATFSNPEAVTINLFSTPGINWSQNNILVQEVNEMIERVRADSLYVIDSPDIDIPQTIGMRRNDVRVAREMADLLDAVGIDSNYSCTYAPWVQIRDTQNGVNVFVPPTGEVVAAIAFTDKVKFPWFAPAGLQRGVTNARQSKYRMSSEARGILYKNRINPMADFANTGTTIFGQKTLQKRESALDRINVRRLLLQMKVLISNIAIRLVFEPNDETVMEEFITKTQPILDNIKRERGLYEFEIKMDDTINTPESIDRNELYGEIGIQPTKTVEYIGIKFNITPTGASFEDV